MRPSRRKLLASTAVLSALCLVAACGAPKAAEPAKTGGTVPDKPASAVVLNVLDVAGNLQLTQPMIDEFVAKNRDIVSRVTYSKATAPELVGKVKAQQDAN